MNQMKTEKDNILQSTESWGELSSKERRRKDQGRFMDVVKEDMKADAVGEKMQRTEESTKQRQMIYCSDP